MIGFGRNHVSGRSREPKPAVKIMPMGAFAMPFSRESVAIDQLKYLAKITAK
jgi:hypothetical protein